MTTTSNPEPGTAVATTKEKSTVAKRVDERVQQLRERNQLAAQIRGTQWGKDCSRDVIMAVAHYCNENRLDPVRHVEILGGRPYLTAELYDEKGAPLIREGIIIPHEPDIISPDDRLEQLAAAGDPWAKEESVRRLRLRIQHGAPASAKAVVIQRFTIAATGATIIGVNWVGTGKRDPVGDAEPTKTAITRARRRAWKQIADVIPGYGQEIRPLEQAAAAMAKTLPVSVIERHEPRAIAATSSGYDTPEPVHVPRGEAETRVVKGPPKGLDTANAHADLATPYDDEPPIDDLDILDEDERRELEERRG